MIREFIETEVFRKQWKDAGLNDQDLLLLQQALLAKPDAGDVIVGTSGLRKIRVQASGRGKSGGGRVLYKDFSFAGKMYLLFFILKKKQENLTAEQKKKISAVIKSIEEDLQNG